MYIFGVFIILSCVRGIIVPKAAQMMVDLHSSTKSHVATPKVASAFLVLVIILLCFNNNKYSSQILCTAYSDMHDVVVRVDQKHNNNNNNIIIILQISSSRHSQIFSFIFYKRRKHTHTHIHAHLLKRLKRARRAAASSAAFQYSHHNNMLGLRGESYGSIY